MGHRSVAPIPFTKGPLTLCRLAALRREARGGVRWPASTSPSRFRNRRASSGAWQTQPRSRGSCRRIMRYVAMTRGREANTAFVAVDRPDIAHVGPRSRDDKDATARSVLCGVLQHVGAEEPAHETIVAQQDTWGSVAQLAAEYETIAAAAQHDRWTALVRGTGLNPGQADQAIKSRAFGALTSELRRAEAHHFDVDNLLAHAVAAGGFEDAQDPTAILCNRIATAIARDAAAGRSRKTPRMVVGLIPKAVGPMAADMRQALEERIDLIKGRASAVLDEALLAGDAWTRDLGAIPNRSVASGWKDSARTVAAYRDRYAISGASALGRHPQTTAQRRDAVRARAALEAARRLATRTESFGTRSPGFTAVAEVVRIQI